MNTENTQSPEKQKNKSQKAAGNKLQETDNTQSPENRETQNARNKRRPNH